MAGIDQLIISSPYKEPEEHWAYIPERKEFEKRPGRRPASYWRSTQRTANNYDDPGEAISLELVNRIRGRVSEWRKNDYPNVTGTTRKLLQYWRDPEMRQWPLFWCQLEAAETAIWLTESLEVERQGITIPSDGSEWERQCLKLATGTGKTIVMAMLIAWQTLNKISNPRDDRFSKHILIVAPGITVRDRLQVLLPDNADNFYQAFNLVDSVMWQDLLQAKIIVTNWHTLAPLDENSGPKVVKKGPESDEAFTRRTLPDFGGASNILVFNDEAHHCHRPIQGEEGDKLEQEEATIWISGIDRVHRARKVLRAYDLTATPFIPTGHNNQADTLFPWVVSDFGLNDSIESGLVKTPTIAVRDDSASTQDLRARFFHIYPEVKDDLIRATGPEVSLPSLVENAVNILGADWLKKKEDWEKEKRETPPVMIMIANRVETASRLEYSLSHGRFQIEELGDKDHLLNINQDALDKLEAEEGGTMDEAIKSERDKFNSVGKVGRPGEKVHCVIGVNMLSEGWDARTVTHILGLRAFTSQLLCEQVVGRGLRRTKYEVNSETGFFDPEYVTVFGIPFTFLPVEGQDTKKGPTTEKPTIKIEPLKDRVAFEISWPHVIRVERKLNYFLDLDWDNVPPLTLSSDDAPTVVEVAPVVDGRPRLDMLKEVDLERLAEQHRLQKLKLQAAVRLHEELGNSWEGDPASHIGQLMEVLDKFLDSDKLKLKIPTFAGTDKLKNIFIALNLSRITNHISTLIKSSSIEAPVAIFDHVRPVRSTATAPIWYTAKRTQPAKKSQMNLVVIDGTWEGRFASELDRNRISGVTAWVKNDHLGFEIYYLWQGQVKTYYPDFIIKFEGNRHLIVEVKGQTTDQDKAKWEAAGEWVMAVNANGGFGTWEFKVIKDPTDIFEVVK
jgi:type III restriction enzyme